MKLSIFELILKRGNETLGLRWIKAKGRNETLPVSQLGIYGVFDHKSFEQRLREKQTLAPVLLFVIAKHNPSTWLMWAVLSIGVILYSYDSFEWLRNAYRGPQPEAEALGEHTQTEEPEKEYPPDWENGDAHWVDPYAPLAIGEIMKAISLMTYAEVMAHKNHHRQFGNDWEVLQLTNQLKKWTRNKHWHSNRELLEGIPYSMVSDFKPNKELNLKTI